MPSLSEQLTDHFYEWELRGRGWYVFDVPVTPEPPFQPFRGHRADLYTTPDDGQRQTLISSLLRRFSSPTKQLDESPIKHDDEESVEIDAREELIHLAIVPPKGQSFPKDLTEQFLLNLSQARHPICLEFMAKQGVVSIHMSVDSNDAATVTNLLTSHFPDVIVTPKEDLLLDCWQDQYPSTIVEFGLAEEFMLPLRSYRSYNPDPLIGIIAALSSLAEDEVACLHALFEPARHAWSQSIRRAVTTFDGKPFFSNAPELTKEALGKLASPMYGVVIRAAAQSPQPDRHRTIIRQLSGALGVLDKEGGNRLIPLDNDLYDENEHQIDLRSRSSRRSGMILSADELLSLVHLPGASVTTPALVRSARRTKRAPEIARGSLMLGENEHAGESVVVGQSLEQRLRHTHLIGASGTGKSTMLASMIRQDIEAGNGVGVLDPHGDLIDRVLQDIPPERFDDVVLLDLSDDAYPIPFNILSAHSDLDKMLLASDLGSVFQRLATSWGDQMTAVLANAILAFLESSRGGTLADLRRFLVEKKFREAFLPTVQDPEVVYYWRHEYPLLSGKPQGSVVTRLNTFLRPKPLRYMVAHGENRLNVSEMMDKGKIFLARIPQGAIGEENAYLLGTLLVSAFYRSALSRQDQDVKDRRPFFLYIDEFHHFIAPSMAQILSGARKYKMGLILAHQEMKQLESRDSDVASAVVSNPGTRVCFRLGDQDARRLESGFGFFEAADLQSLGVGQAIARMERSEFDFNLSVPAPPPPDAKDEAAERVAEIRRRSRAKYAVPRSEVEERLAQGREEPPEAPPPAVREAKTPKRGKTPTPPKPKDREPAPVVHETVAGKAVVPEPEVVAPQTAPTPITKPAPHPGALPGVPGAALPGGRGGMKHRSIQHLIKHWAEGMGYRAQIEKPILDGRGAVDVALYKGDESIACEISITTPTDHECANLEKCIRAKFNTIVMLADDEEHLKKIEKKAKSALEIEVFKCVHFMTPQQFFRFIEGRDDAHSEPSNIRGYKVTVNKSGADSTRRTIRMKSIKRTIADAAVRTKKRGHDGTQTRS